MKALRIFLGLAGMVAIAYIVCGGSILVLSIIKQVILGTPNLG